MRGEFVPLERIREYSRGRSESDLYDLYLTWKRSDPERFRTLVASLSSEERTQLEARERETQGYRA